MFYKNNMKGWKSGGISEGHVRGMGEDSFGGYMEVSVKLLYRPVFWYASPVEFSNWTTSSIGSD